MDLLEGGSDRPGWRERAGVPSWRRVLRASPPRWAVAAVAAAAVVTLGSAALAVAPVGAAEDREADRLDLVVRGAGGSTAFRPLGPATGELVLEVENRQDRPVDLRAVAVEVPGVEAGGPVPRLPRPVPPSGTVQVTVGFVVAECRELVPQGLVRVTVAPPGRPEQQVTQQVRVRDQSRSDAAPDVVDGGLLAAGCLLVEDARRAITGTPE